jgi:hypothetical protein
MAKVDEAALVLGGARTPVRFSEQIDRVERAALRDKLIGRGQRVGSGSVRAISPE